MHKDLSHIIVPSEAIEIRLNELGQTITADYRSLGTEEITLICVTNGSIVFAADLMRVIHLYARLDCVRVSSYQQADRPLMDPQIIDQVRLDLTGHHVLIIDDILDTGKTLSTLISVLGPLEPASLKVCVLLEKQGRCQSECQPQYVGFQVPNDFVVGYGLDFAERYRNLPYIGVLRPEFQQLSVS